jgi:hypothetical protein
MKWSNMARLKELERDTHGEIITLRVVYDAGPNGEPAVEGPTYTYTIPPHGWPIREDDDES